ncbi:mitochondrial chaperone BCS1 [Angomonas deanei]|nr:mitochondrial chaperone BCS1 [Angomonas deanei]|eukprot:EPY35360.1 mitochondrial chaperone BCS1 [Angomonas deanei]
MRRVFQSTCTFGGQRISRRFAVSPLELFTSPGGLMALLYGKNSTGDGNPKRGKRITAKRGEAKKSGFFSNDMVLLGLIVFILSATWEVIKTQKPVVLEKIKNTFMTTLEVRTSQEEFAMIVDWMARQPEGSHCRNITLKPIAVQDENRQERVFNSSLTKEQDEESRAALVPGYGVHLFRFNGVRLWVRRDMDASKQRFAATNMDRENDVLTLTFFTRDRRVVESFLTEVRSSWKRHVQNKVQIYHAVHSEWRLLTEKSRRPLDTLYLPESTTKLVEETKRFFDMKDLYLQLGIPWRRGYLLEGPPGTGKSSFVHALAGELCLPVHILSLQNAWMDDTTLLRCVSQLPPKCILLIEDIENAVRHSADDPTEIGGSKQAGVSMSALLNALDGITTSQGRLLIMTSNNTAKIPLPEALLRPGRIDRRIEFTSLGASDYSRMHLTFKRVVEEWSKKRSLGTSSVDSQSMESFENLSPALYQQKLLNTIYDVKTNGD